MRKRRQAQENKTLAEMLAEQEPASMVLFPETYRPLSWNNTQERCGLLKNYADIVTSTSNTWSGEELAAATDWYRKYGFPGRFGKHYAKGDIARRTELVTPILLSAKSIKALLDIYDAWKTEVTEPLIELPESLKELPESLKELRVIRSSLRSNDGPEDFPDDLDLTVEKKRGRQQKIIQSLLEKQKAKKLPYLRNLHKSDNLDKKSTNLTTSTDKQSDSKQYIYFKNIDNIYYSDEYYFAYETIPPIVLSEADLLVDDEKQLLEQTEAFLFTAANIMLRGIRLEVIRNESAKNMALKWIIRYPWHAIAIAFAELLTNSSITLNCNLCKGCGKDISDLKTKECSDKCRKRVDRKKHNNNT